MVAIGSSKSYLPEGTNSQVLPQNELPYLYRSLLHDFGEGSTIASRFLEVISLQQRFACRSVRMRQRSTTSNKTSGRAEAVKNLRGKME